MNDGGDWENCVADADVSDAEVQHIGIHSAETQAISDNEFYDALEVVQNDGCASLTFDLTKFEKYFEDESLTEAQKQEFLQVLWNFAVAAISFNLGIHPVQQATEICGQFNDERREIAQPPANLLDSGKDNRRSVSEDTQLSTSVDEGKHNA